MGRTTDDADPTLPPELGAGSGAAFAATIAGGPTAPPAPPDGPVPTASAVVTRPVPSAGDPTGLAAPHPAGAVGIPTHRLAAFDPTGGATHRLAALDAAATLDAPVPGEPSILPYVPMTNYRPEREIARGGM